MLCLQDQGELLNLFAIYFQIKIKKKNKNSDTNILECLYK